MNNYEVSLTATEINLLLETIRGHYGQLKLSEDKRIELEELSYYFSVIQAFIQESSKMVTLK